MLSQDLDWFSRRTYFWPCSFTGDIVKEVEIDLTNQRIDKCQDELVFWLSIDKCWAKNAVSPYTNEDDNDFTYVPSKLRLEIWICKNTFGKPFLEKTM